MKIITIFIIAFILCGTAQSSQGNPFTKSKRPSVCKVKTTGNKTLRVKAETYEKAFTRATESCFQKKKQHFLNNKKKLSAQRQLQQEQEILFVNACLKHIRCV